MAGFLLRNPSLQHVDANGDVYPGAKLNVYLTGTTTRTNSYQDSGLATPHANPVVADSAGLFAPIYLDPSITYKLELTDSADVVIQTVDPYVIEVGTGNFPFKDLTPAANKIPYYTGVTTGALTDFTALGRTIVGSANEAGFKASLNLEPGVDVQAWDAHLDDIAAITPSTGDLIYFNGTDWVRRAIGAANTALTVVGGVPTWSAGSLKIKGVYDINATLAQTNTASTRTLFTSPSITGSAGDVIELELDRSMGVNEIVNSSVTFITMVEWTIDGAFHSNAIQITGGSPSVVDNYTAVHEGSPFRVEVADSSSHTYGLQLDPNSSHTHGGDFVGKLIHYTPEGAIT